LPPRVGRRRRLPGPRRLPGRRSPVPPTRTRRPSFVEEGDAAGSEFKQQPGCRRLANLVDKGDVFREAIAMPRLLEYVRHVLGPAMKLSSLNVRSVLPEGEGAQPLHADMAA